MTALAGSGNPSISFVAFTVTGSAAPISSISEFEAEPNLESLCWIETGSADATSASFVESALASSTVPLSLISESKLKLMPESLCSVETASAGGGSPSSGLGEFALLFVLIPEDVSIFSNYEAMKGWVKYPDSLVVIKTNEYEMFSVKFLVDISARSRR